MESDRRGSLGSAKGEIGSKHSQCSRLRGDPSLLRWCWKGNTAERPGGDVWWQSLQANAHWNSLRGCDSSWPNADHTNGRLQSGTVLAASHFICDSLFPDSGCVNTKKLDLNQLKLCSGPVFEPEQQGRGTEPPSAIVRNVESRPMAEAPFRSILSLSDFVGLGAWLVKRKAPRHIRH